MVSAAVVSAASGMGQFAITAVIGDVARAFGTVDAGTDLTSQIGLQATTLGIALAVIRLASLASLPGSAIADHLGRRRVLLLALVVGLALTGSSAFAPTFWTWVALVALARPWLSTVNAVSGVVAAEETSARYRSWAIGLIAATYGIGSGVISIGRSLLPEGFRPVMLAVFLPLLALPWLARTLVEPPVAARAHLAETAPALPGAVPRPHRRDLARLVAVAAGIAVATGPGFTYVFVYGESILGLARSTMALVVLAAGPVGLVGLLAGRWLSDHVGRRPCVAVGLVGTGLGFAGTYSGAVPLMFVGYLVGILAGGAIGPGLGAAAAEVFPTEVRATVAGWLAAAGVLGAVVGLAGFGILADATGGFGGAARILALVPVVVTLALRRLPETRGWELDGRPPPSPGAVA
nr:MFS transporter [Salsipaludibacter albus]